LAEHNQRNKNLAFEELSREILAKPEFAEILKYSSSAFVLTRKD
jgi:hypothetical protein